MQINNVSLSVQYPNYNNVISFLTKKFMHGYYFLLDKKYRRISNNKLFNTNIFSRKDIIYSITNNKSKYYDILKEKKYLNVLNITFAFNYEKIQDESIKYYDLTKFDIEYNILAESGIDYLGLKLDNSNLVLQIYAHDKNIKDNIYNFFKENEVK